MTRFAAVTGRFQPFHLGHLELVRIAAAHSDELIIGITNPDPASWREHADSTHRHRPESNPFTYWQRYRMIAASLRDLVGREQLPIEGWSIVPFPLDRREVWADYIPLQATQFVRAFTDWEHSKARELHDGGYRVQVVKGDPDAVLRASAIRSAWREAQSIDHLVPGAVALAMSQHTASTEEPGVPVTTGGRP